MNIHIYHSIYTCTQNFPLLRKVCGVGGWVWGWEYTNVYLLCRWQTIIWCPHNNNDKQWKGGERFSIETTQITLTKSCGGLRFHLSFLFFFGVSFLFVCSFAACLCTFRRIILYKTRRRRVQIKETTIQLHFKCALCACVVRDGIRLFVFIFIFSLESGLTGFEIRHHFHFSSLSRLCAHIWRSNIPFTTYTCLNISCPTSI